MNRTIKIRTDEDILLVDEAIKLINDLRRTNRKYKQAEAEGRKLGHKKEGEYGL